MTRPIEAAGGVLIRRDGEQTQVAIVHRPRYDDWSLPKGKLKRGETFEQAALREVCEETGYRCELGPNLGTSRYTDKKGRTKLVRWWLMLPGPGAFIANDEVDELRWCGVDEALGLLDYTDQQGLVREALRA